MNVTAGMKAARLMRALRYLSERTKGFAGMKGSGEYERDGGL